MMVILIKRFYQKKILKRKLLNSALLRKKKNLRFTIKLNRNFSYYRFLKKKKMKLLLLDKINKYSKKFYESRNKLCSFSNKKKKILNNCPSFNHHYSTLPNKHPNNFFHKTTLQYMTGFVNLESHYSYSSFFESIQKKMNKQLFYLKRFRFQMLKRRQSILLKKKLRSNINNIKIIKKRIYRKK